MIALRLVFWNDEFGDVRAELSHIERSIRFLLLLLVIFILFVIDALLDVFMTKLRIVSVADLLIVKL